MFGTGQIASRPAKRALDVLASGCGLVILSPVLAAIAAAVRLSSPGPVLYRGLRVGRRGVEFNILKFRTMVVGADRQGPAVTVGGDPRITPVGRLLRRAKLDELPQLINVLRGDMSLVGPRPEHPSYVRLYSSDQRRVLSVRPGITGVSALAYSNEERALERPDAEAYYREVLMPAKLDLELEYLDTGGFVRDLRIIVATLARVIRKPRPADAPARR